MFKHAWGAAKSEEGFANKSYEQILEEYEKFFNLENEMYSGDSRNSTQVKTKGANVFKKIEHSFAETIVGIQKIIGYKRYLRCESCEGKKVKATDN